MFICATYRAHQRAGLPFCHFAILPFLVPEFKSNASITRKHGGGTLQTLQTAYKRACGGTRHAQYGACHRCSTHVHTGGMYERRQESGSKLGTLTVHAHKPLSRHHGRLGQDHVTRSQGQPQARQGVGRHAHGRPLAKDAAQHCTQVQLHTLHILQGGMWGGGTGRGARCGVAAYSTWNFSRPCNFSRTKGREISWKLTRTVPLQNTAKNHLHTPQST